MSEKLEKKILSDEEYMKYLEEIKEYYELKKKFTKQQEIYKSKIINSKDSLENKKKLFAKKKYVCVNCGNEGGTIFSESNNMLKATCGNIKSPCTLNIEIVKMKKQMVNDEFILINNKITDIKNKIIATKMDVLFNYIDEDKAVEDFDNYKKELDNYQEIYNELYNLLNIITNNPEKKSALNEKLLEHAIEVNNLKEFITLYKKTNESKYLQEAMELYNSNIKPLDLLIRDLKYNHNTIEILPDTSTKGIYEKNIVLIQDEYNIKNLEIIKFPE
tara:strand:+ start:2124 stop:2945 length:822 start_codon:yes stop_codon:yes gene_type:complete